jgi:hypothetical protein
MNKETKKNPNYNLKAIDVLVTKFGLSAYYIKQSISGNVKGITPDTLRKEYKSACDELEAAEKKAVQKLLTPKN